MPMTLINQAVQRVAAQVTQTLLQQSQTAPAAEIATRRAELRAALAQSQRQNDLLKALHDNLVNARHRLEQARLDGDAAAVQAAAASLQQNLSARAQALSTRAVAAQTARDKQQALVTALGAAGMFQHLDAAAPLALLPVRLETRYFERDATFYELRVRIFPDDIHLDQHQPEPSRAEVLAGHQYWKTRLADGPDADATVRAWEGLCERLGEARALWLAGQLDPYRRGGCYRPGDGGPAAPPIPSLQAAPEGWVEPAKARLLPDRWAVAGYYGDHRVLLAWSGPVTPDLPLTPEFGAPGSETPGQADPLAEADAGVRWLTDFAAAEAAGMALRIPVEKIIARIIDRLLVFGVRAGETAAESAAALTGLLEAQAGVGLDFVALGSPTNNTEMVKSAYRARTIDHRRSHARLLGADPTGPAGSNAARTAQAFGVDAGVFRYAWGGRQLREAFIQAMHTALWPTTVGAFLKRVLETAVAQPTQDFAVEQFVRHVRGEGLLPSLRIGLQPYGLLPAISLQRYRPTPPSAQATVFRHGLLSLLTYWKRGLQDRGHRIMPRLFDANDVQRELIDALAMAPASVIDRATQYSFMSGQDPAAFAAFWPPALAALQENPIDVLGTYGGKRLGERMFSLHSAIIDIARPLVSSQDDKSLPLTNNYIAALAARPARQSVLAHRNIPGAEERPLLYLLLRSAYLEVFEATATAPLADAFIEALGALQTLPAAELETLLTEATDVCAYRLDAWVGSLANARLQQLRAAAPQGIQLGAFGWVEGLDCPGVGASPGAAPQEEPDNAGFLHLPSLPQARTAALLHGAWLAHAGQGPLDTFAIDLRSTRTQRAKELLEGLRQGQSLGALLGYRLERYLIDRNQASILPQVRAAAPPDLTGVSPAADGVDGLRLYRLSEAEFQSLLDSLPNNNARNALKDGRKAIDDALDALGDLLLAEGVHQTVNGNPTRAAAAFDALAEGGAPAVDPEVVQTPVAGRQIAQRLATLLPAQPGPGWPGDDQRLRALAEPRLNGWAAALLGPPQNIGFSAFVASGDGVEQRRDHTLAEFDLCPLDICYLAAAQPRQAPLLALLQLRLRLAAATPDSAVEIVIDPAGGHAARSLADALTLAHGLARVLNVSLPLNADHLMLTAGAGAAQTADSELTARAATVKTRFATLQADYVAAPDAPANWWRAALLAGPVDPALPDSVAALTLELAQRQRACDQAPDPAAQLQALLGREFKLAPLFQPPQPAGLAQAFADQDSLLEGDPLKPRRWLQDYARVRPNVETLDTLLTLSEALGGAVDLQVGQTPWQAGQVWIGERLAAAAAPRLALAAHTPLPLAFEQPLAGLLVDSWTEAIPEPRVVTGVAFHYDEPKAQAPQAVLLAAPPDPQRGWSFEDLEATLLETLELAKIRGVLPEHIRDDDDVGDELATYLPAVYLFDDLRAELSAG